MNSVGRGMIAGLAATAILSLMMMAKSAVGLMPALDPINMIATMMGVTTAMGWIIHFMIGAVFWGIGFALIQSYLPGGALWVRGIVFATGAWLIMMVMMMPMAGAGMFGMQMGIMAPIMTLMMHIVFGAVLGGVYGTMGGRTVAAAI